MESLRQKLPDAFPRYRCKFFQQQNSNIFLKNSVHLLQHQALTNWNQDLHTNKTVQSTQTVLDDWFQLKKEAVGLQTLKSIKENPIAEPAQL
jgi:hypothetical protein